MRYRKKPVVVEAVQFVAPDPEAGVDGNRDELKEWGAPIMRVAGWNDGDYRLELAVVKGGSTCTVNPGDWVIREPLGDGFYPCTAEDFDATYAPEEDGDKEPDDAELLEQVEFLSALVADLEQRLAAAHLQETAAARLITVEPSHGAPDDEIDVDDEDPFA